VGINIRNVVCNPATKKTLGHVELSWHLQPCSANPLRETSAWLSNNRLMLHSYFRPLPEANMMGTSAGQEILWK
jgi:hypothetical protein